MRHHGSRTRKKHFPPIPTWTCPHCQHVHTPATLGRLDSVTVQCEQWLGTLRSKIAHQQAEADIVTVLVFADMLTAYIMRPSQAPVYQFHKSTVTPNSTLTAPARRGSRAMEEGATNGWLGAWSPQRYFPIGAFPDSFCVISCLQF